MAKKKTKAPGSISGEKVVTAETIIVHRDLILDGTRKEAGSEALSFARIRLDSPYWTAQESPRSGWKDLYPFDRVCKQHFYLNSHLELQDPVFDVLISNNRQQVAIVLKIGFLIAEVAEVTYMYGGFSPKSFRIMKQDVFKIQMPRIKSYWPSLPDSYPPRKENVEVEMRNELIQQQLDDPIGIEPGQPYRFDLQLFDYISNMPNNVLGRIVIRTAQGKFESDMLYLFTY